jgi:hypothetical protein
MWPKRGRQAQTAGASGAAETATEKAPPDQRTPGKDARELKLARST